MNKHHIPHQLDKFHVWFRFQYLADRAIREITGAFCKPSDGISEWHVTSQRIHIRVSIPEIPVKNKNGDLCVIAIDLPFIQQSYLFWGFSLLRV